MALFDFNALPGLGTSMETAEKFFLWGKHEQVFYRSAVLLSTGVDYGASPNTTIRAGMAMAQYNTGASVNLWTPYNPTATDGSEVCQGFLAYDIRLLNVDGTLSNKIGVVVVAGGVKGDQLFYNGPVSSTTVTGLDQQGRSQVNGKVIFDDNLVGNPYPWIHWIPKTANYTVLLTDNATVFTTAGASTEVDFTLPSLLDANSNPQCKGMRFKFFNEVGQTMKVLAAGSDKIVSFNNAVAVSLSFQTASNLIGACVEIETNAAGTKWVAEYYGANTVTVS